jgi:dTDP-L-rhamnose 4-epimerase
MATPAPRDETILITGGAGFIGTALARHLDDRGRFRVVAVDALHHQVHERQQWPAAYPEGAERLTLDVTVPHTWDEVLDRCRPDVIVHLAAETGTGQSLHEASRHGRVNVVGCTEMLDGLSRAGQTPRVIVLASSRAVYGEGQWVDDEGHVFSARPRDVARLARGEWVPAAPPGAGAGLRPAPHDALVTPPDPTSVYAATKLAQEHVLRAWCLGHGTTLAVLRLQNVYGPGQSLSNPYTGIVSFFAQLALRGAAIEVYEDGGIIRDFVFIEDVVHAISAAIDTRADWDAPIDIGFGRAITLLELARLMAEQASAPPPTTSRRFRAGDVRAAYADIRRAREALAYAPLTDLSAGVQQLFAWIRSVGLERGA